MTEKIEARRIRDLTISCFECNKSMKYLGMREESTAVTNWTESIFLCSKCKRIILVSNGDYDGDPEDMILTLTHPIDPKEAEEFYLTKMKNNA